MKPGLHVFHPPFSFSNTTHRFYPMLFASILRFCPFFPLGFLSQYAEKLDSTTMSTAKWKVL